jgi:hypothetical protein
LTLTVLTPIKIKKETNKIFLLLSKIMGNPYELKQNPYSYNGLTLYVNKIWGIKTFFGYHLASRD